jgi:hypothetical protein
MGSLIFAANALRSRPWLVMFEVLYRPFVFFRSSFAFKGAEISALPGLCIFLPRIYPIFSRFKFPNHMTGCLSEHAVL